MFYARYEQIHFVKQITFSFHEVNINFFTSSFNIKNLCILPGSVVVCIFWFLQK
jgi:hypothetical protein